MNPIFGSALALAEGFVTGAIISVVRWGKGVAPSSIELSSRRIQSLAFVAEVVPSKYGDDRFSKLAPGFNATHNAAGELVLTSGSIVLPKGMTTCGYLPCYVGKRFGDPRGITQCGLEQARKNAIAEGSWVKAGGDARPKPGDIFLVVDRNDVPLHVGIYIGMNADGTWRTADAGQGSHEAQEAKYLSRTYDPANVTLSSLAGPRKLAGWVDLDKVKLHDVNGVAGVVLDVRTAGEYRKGHMDGAENVHVDSLSGISDLTINGETIDKCRPLFVYCASGGRSRRAAFFLKNSGYNVTDFGGWR